MKYLQKLYATIKNHPIIFAGCLALILNLIIECLSRRSVLDCLSFIVHQPVVFIYNALIIMLTLSIALLTKKRVFTFTLISILWLTVGITNFVILGFRMTPFAATDLGILNSAIDMIDIYFSPVQIVLIALGLSAIIAGIIYMWIKCPKFKIHYLKSASTVVILTIILILTTNVSIKANAISTSFGNLADAYDEYGFAYCFSCSIIDTGIDKPQDYSEEEMASIINKIHENYKNDTLPPAQESKPNIIVVQLESFFDPATMTNISLSADPIPVFNKLKKEYSSGYFTVPAVGAGTANTEFEVLTGMSTDFFGAGEYPYKTILKSSACESLPYNLYEQGYLSHAIHNHTSTFYGRNTVYSMLGFDTFSGLEYMNNVEYTQMGWAKDNVLTSEIMKALESTEDKDFVFTVSVQAHGKYPSNAEGTNKEISADGFDSESYKAEFDYYLTQIHETDAFIGDLLSKLESYNEPTVLVLYGDHLPGFSFSKDDFINKSIYQTEYVIWDNIGLKKDDQDLPAYQLSSHLMSLLGYDNGILTKFHKALSQDESYQHDLELLEYDMLYGHKYIYGQNDAYSPTNLQMGTLQIEISDVYVNNDNIYIKGNNFNEFSKVYINDNKENTEYIDENTLMVTDYNLSAGDKVEVGQVSQDKDLISCTSPYIY